MGDCPMSCFFYLAVFLFCQIALIFRWCLASFTSGLLSLRRLDMLFPTLELICFP